MPCDCKLKTCPVLRCYQVLRHSEKSEKYSCVWKVLETFLLWSEANGINLEDKLYQTAIYFIKNKVSAAQGDD